MRACFMLASVSTPSLPVREREKKSEKERQREREKERQRKREYLFLKGMTDALAPFSYLVTNICKLRRKKFNKIDPRSSSRSHTPIRKASPVKFVNVSSFSELFCSA